MKKGILYGLGLGPGDPELITLKAHNLIKTARVIAYPTLESGASFARSIIADSLPKGVEEITIPIPMSNTRELAQAAYDTGAKQIAERLNTGTDVLVLCEGDPFFYGSFMYLFARLATQFDTRVIAGVTSLSACAAAIPAPLCARNETLTVIPAPMEAADLMATIKAAGSCAIIKLGRHLPKVQRILRDLGLEGYATYIERATLPTEKIMPLAETCDPAPYFSMIIVNKGSDPWL